MKVPLTDQIEFATRMRDSLAVLAADGALSKTNMSTEDKLDMAEAIVLTLRWLQVYEPDFRQYMRDRSARSE